MAQIKTYCRIKPTNKISSFFDWDEDRVCIGVRTAGASGNSFDKTRTSTITHDTEFSHVFGPTVTQAEIFDVVASNIVEGCLAGYNGTIFAYGQTGSGKTYTIEGGSRTYADRGVAPRALSTVYQSIQKLTSSDVTIQVSYLEIYQDTGYDLLNPTARMSGVVAHLPKVSVRDGPGNSCIIRNLSTHLAADENIAQNLLHQGRVSRRIAETSSNQRSSRSHAIFTIYLTQHDRKSDVIRKSKLHLVDLAGSERAAKSGIKGNQLSEAKSINLSLHHLEGVIIALQKMAQSERRERRQRSSSAGPYRQKRISSASSSRSLPYDRRSVGELANPRHVPYRNSLLTMLLKDSLGGNCLTAMVATLSVQDINIGESLSTCRFAQRVACIKNHASRNEELDDKMIIKRLRKRVLELEKEIKNMKQGIQSPCKETDNIVEVSSGVCNECKRRQEPANLSINVIQNAQVPEDPTDIPVTDPTIDRDTRKRCVKIMHGFIGGKIKDPVASGIKNMDQFRICLQLLREMLMRSYAVGQRSKGRQVLQHPNSRSAESFAIRSKSTPNLQTAVTVGISKRDDRYQSPFEKKQENAIKKVRTRVQCRHSDQKIQKKNLLEFQTSIREQQLMLLHKELNGKVLKVKSQVARQRALLRNLKDNLGDAGEIEMEKTALKQLIKRGTRYENRLQVVNEQLKIIDQQYQHQKEAESCTVTSAASVELRNDKPSTQNQSSNPLIGSESDGRGSADLEATISSFKESVANKNSGKDGKVNTRKVLEILKKEEEKQAKIQSVLDEVRLESVNSHLALKEQVTRQKLEDFRKMLRQSKEAGNTSGGNTNSHDLHTASISSRKLVKASTYNCNTSEKDSQDSNTISMTSTPTIDVYVAPKVAKNQPKNAWNKRHEDHAVQRTDFHYNSTNSKSEIMAPKDSSAIVVSNDFSAGAKKSGIAQNFQISASTIHHQTSKTSFDTALDNMLQDSFVSGSDKATLTNSAGTSMVVAPTNHATSLNLINENNSMPTLSGDDLKATDYSTPDKTSEPEPHHSFVKKSDDFSKLQQKLSEYLGARQSSTPKTRPTMMSASHGSLQSSVDIPSFYNPSQDKLTSTSTTSPKHLAQDLRSRDFLQRSLTTLNSSDSKGLPFDRAYRQMFPSTASLPSYSNRAYENEVNEFSFKSNTTPKLPSDISLPLRKDSFPSSFLPEPSKLLAAPVEDNDREVSYVRAVKENKLRVKKIHEAREAAAVIQKAWKGYVKKK